MQIDPKSNLPEYPRRLYVFTGLVFVFALIVSFLISRATHDKILVEATVRFDAQVDQLETTLRAQFPRIDYGLRGLAGLYVANGRFQHETFRNWVASHDLERQYPGVRSLGFIERVQRPQLAQFVTARRNDQAPVFSVETSGDAPEMYVIKYIEPQTLSQPVWGLDVGSEAFSREAIENVIAYGDPILTRPTSSDQGKLWGSDFLYLLPLFQPGSNPETPEQRRAALVGVMFAPITLEELLHSTSDGLTDFEIFDGSSPSAESIAFSSINAVSMHRGTVQPVDFSTRQFYAQRKLLVHERPLTLRVGSSPLFEAGVDVRSPWIMAIAGFILSTLLAWVFWLVMAGRAQAQILAQRMTQDLDRLARVVKSTSHVVILGDAQRRISWANEAFTHVSGLPLEQAVGINFADLFQRDQNDPRSRELFRTAMDNQESLRLQIPWRMPDGTQRWFDLDLQTEADEAGHFSGYIAIASDITAQHIASNQIAAALRENQQLMDALDMHSIVSVADHRGIITYVNDMFCQISGYSREELLGSNHRIVKSDQQDDTFWEAMWKTIASGHTWRATVCNRAKNGQPYWVDSVIAPFFDEAGNIEKYVSIRSNVTPAHQAKLELANEREHLSAILEGTDAGTWEWEVPSGRLLLNSRWAEILGYTMTELGTASIETWASFCHPDDLLLAKELLAQHFNGTLKSYSCEIRMRHREGHWVWVLSSGKVSSWGASGQPQWVSGIHLDISTQKALQAELRQNNQVMQSILENIPVALSVFDSDLKLIARNDKFLELLEFPAWLFEGETTSFESLIRHNAARGEYGSGDVEQAVQFIIERARHTTPHQFERVRPNGRALEVRGAPMPSGGFITTYADISERKSAEAEIQRSTRLLQSVLDAASEVAVIAVDLDTRITLFNKGAERIFGYSAQDVVGHMFATTLFDAGDLQEQARLMSEQAGYPISGLGVLTDASVLGKRTEWTTRHQDGHGFKSALVVTPIRDGQDKRSGYLCVSFDITQEKKNEQALHQAVALAQQAALSKGQFLANMSHEIRTPMNAVLGMLTLLQNTELDERQLDYSAKAESAARSLLGLLNDILDFSKAEAGKMQLDPHPFSVGELLSGLHVILSGNLASRAIELVLDVDPSLPDVLVGDALRLQQILINLGGNAIKFTEQGQVRISIQQRLRTDHNVQLRILVKDSGIGIDPVHQQHIFSGFSQAEASTTRRFGGSGLGLSICRRLVALMGGELQLDSALGQGSTFYFDVTLPIASPEQAASLAAPLWAPTPSDSQRNASPTKGTPKKKKVQRLSGMRLLVVEDNPINQQVAKELLGAEGAFITLADNGQLGVEAVAHAKAPFDAVLMDMQMPVMDGYTAAHTIRANLGLTDLPIIAVTANAMASDREACIAAGMNDHIGKPFDLQRLIAMLLRYTGRESGSSLSESDASTESPEPLLILHPDIAAAMERVGGNTALYLQILQAFLLEVMAMPRRLQDLLDQHDVPGALRLLHTTKGLSLTVGAQHLSQVCKDGESTLKSTPNTFDAPELGARVATAVEATVSQLKAAQTQIAASLPLQTQTVDDAPQTSNLRADLQTLQSLLRASDMQSLDVFAQMSPSPEISDGSDWLPLQSAMMTLDFEKALVYCGTLIQHLD